MKINDFIGIFTKKNTLFPSPYNKSSAILAKNPQLTFLFLAFLIPFFCSKFLTPSQKKVLLYHKKILEKFLPSVVGLLHAKVFID